MAHRVSSDRLTLRRPVIALSIAMAFGTLHAEKAHAQVSVDVGITTSQPGWLYDAGAVVSLFVDPPLQQPEPVAVAWAPPPMLVEELPPPPDPYAVWTGGYWTWQGDWVWCAGRWMDPPRQQYVWVQPYYEHREDRVIFIPGYWSSPDVEFIAPPVERPIAWAYVNEGVVIGPPPEGPVGIFIPPPPGSRPGLIIPAPIGTPPAVVISAPPVMAVGMRVSATVAIDARHTINDNRVTNYSVTNVRNITNVTVQAPASATASGRAFQAQVPHQAHLAAAMRPQVAARAPAPAMRTAVAAYVPGRTPAALPAAQRVQGLPAVPPHAVANVPQAQRAQMGHAPLTPAESRQARTSGHDVDTQHLPPTAAGSTGARPAQFPASPEARPNTQPAMQQRPVQEPPQERAQLQDRQRAQEEQVRRAEQEHMQRDAQQRSQEEQAQHAQQQRAQQQAQQRTEQQAQRAEQQRAEQEMRQRTQQQAQQRSEQEQAQRMEQQRAQHEAQQRESQQRAAQEQAQRTEQERRQQEQRQRAPQERTESGRQRAEEASRPSN